MNGALTRTATGEMRELHCNERVPVIQFEQCQLRLHCSHRSCMGTSQLHTGTTAKLSPAARLRLLSLFVCRLPRSPRASTACRFEGRLSSLASLFVQ